MKGLYPLSFKKNLSFDRVNLDSRGQKSYRP